MNPYREEEEGMVTYPLLLNREQLMRIFRRGFYLSSEIPKNALPEQIETKIRIKFKEIERGLVRENYGKEERAKENKEH